MALFDVPLHSGKVSLALHGDGARVERVYSLELPAGGPVRAIISGVAPNARHVKVSCINDAAFSINEVTTTQNVSMLRKNLLHNDAEGINRHARVVDLVHQLRDLHRSSECFERRKALETKKIETLKEGLRAQAVATPKKGFARWTAEQTENLQAAWEVCRAKALATDETLWDLDRQQEDLIRQALPLAAELQQLLEYFKIYYDPGELLHAEGAPHDVLTNFVRKLADADIVTCTAVEFSVERVSSEGDSSEVPHAEIKLSYQYNYGISWTPKYRLEVLTSSTDAAPSASLIYEAEVRNSSDDDFYDADVELSTAQMSTGTVPTLRREQVRYLEPRPQRRLMRCAAAPAMPGANFAEIECDHVMMAKEEGFRGCGAVSTNSGIATTFRVKGNSTIRSQQNSQTLNIATMESPDILPFLFRYWVPSSWDAPLSILSLDNRSKWMLLPSNDVAVYVNNEAMGTHHAISQVVAPGETAHICLGIDRMVERSSDRGVKPFESVAGTFSRSRVRRVRCGGEILLASAVEPAGVTVVGYPLPRSADGKIEVTFPDAKTVTARDDLTAAAKLARGDYAASTILNLSSNNLFFRSDAAGGKVALDFEYGINFPADKRVIIETVE